MKEIFCKQVIFFLFCVIFFGIFPVEGKAEYKYQLSICAVFRDQAPYLKEWIEFHRLLGVEHFYLTNHRSQDDYEAVLAPYIHAGIVELKHCNVEIRKNRWNRLQQKIYRETITRAAGETHWLAVIDTDEFLFPVEGGSLAAFLQDYEAYAGLCVNWQLYGTSDVECIGEDELMIEKLVRRAERNYKEKFHYKCVDNYYVKSIVKPHLVDTKKKSGSAHYFIYRQGYFSVNELKKKFNQRRSLRVLVDKIRINHYWSRDIKHFNKRKGPSRVKRHGRQEWVRALKRLPKLNVVEDPILLRYIPELRERVFK